MEGRVKNISAIRFNEPDFTRALNASRSAYDEAVAALEAQAAKTAARMIERRASQYALEPWRLDIIEPGLSKLTPRQLRYRIAGLIGEEVSTPRVGRGLGGEVPLANLKGAMLYAERLMEIVTLGSAP